MSENYAAVLYGPNDIRVEKRPIPEINDYEVLIKMASVGICGSDVKIYSSGRCGLEALEEPMVLGHEGAGYVVKMGSKVSNLKVGDRVAVEPTQPCRACALCRRGRYNLCAAPGYCATTGCPGNLANYYKHVADFCHKIPDNLSMDEAAAVQPLAIALHACSRAGVRAGRALCVLGAGPVGVLCAAAARAMGAADIVITDVVQSRLDTAKAMGADHTVLVTPQHSDEDLVQQITAALGARPDITIDACAAPQAQRVALQVTATGGVVVVVGISEAARALPLAAALLREVDVRGSYRIAHTYPAAVSLVSRGTVCLKPFITHHFPLGRVADALAAAASGEPMKCIIHLD